MFYFVPKDNRHNVNTYASSTTDYVPTLEALEAACRAGKVERVIIPMTYYSGQGAYGDTLWSVSNNRSLLRDYPRSFKTHGMGDELTISPRQFLRGLGDDTEFFRELIEGLAENSPVYDEQDYSNLETDTLTEFIVSELSFALRNEFPNAPLIDANEWSDETIADVLLGGDWDMRIEWWEYVAIDNDGYTPYMRETDLETVLELFLTKWSASNV